MNNITEISWEMHNYCTGGCSYCPNKFWGGESPQHFENYLSVAKNIIDHFLKLNRKINWTFTGGEPLELFELPAILKLCKDYNSNITLHTNGGKLWLDWFALESHIDNLILSYHYWQNFNLIKFIIQTFLSKKKQIILNVPIRPDYFNDDLKRALNIEQLFDINVNKIPLYKNAEMYEGLLNYSDDQLEILFGKNWLINHKNTKKMSYAETSHLNVISSPIYTGKKCNAGIEKLHITANGWVLGSNCNNTNMGNIFNGSYMLFFEPQICNMQSCVSIEDQKITKFT